MSIFPVFAHQVQSNPSHTRGLCRYHRQFWEAAEVYFLKNSEMRKERHRQLALFFNWNWAGKEKPYDSDALKAKVQKTFSEETGAFDPSPSPSATA